MRSDKSKADGRHERGEPVRHRVLDAAERLLRRGEADYSMRDLAAEAGVSFATPFNQFGSKAAIMHALSTRRIDTMTARFAEETSPPSDALGRVLLAVDIAVAVMLAAPAVNRAVMGGIGNPAPAPGDAWGRSTALWTLALAGGAGLAADCRDRALDRLPAQLALAFRGALSFWTAGEMTDDALGPHAREIATSLLRGFADRPSSVEPTAP